MGLDGPGVRVGSDVLLVSASSSINSDKSSVVSCLSEVGSFLMYRGRRERKMEVVNLNQ